MNVTKPEILSPASAPATPRARWSGATVPRGLFLAFAGLLTLGACSGVQPPTERMNGAEVALREAEQAEAVALAPTQMQAAREAYTKAEGAVQHEEYAEASRLAERATVDAKLAGATARAARAQRSLEEMRRSATALEQEVTH